MQAYQRLRADGPLDFRDDHVYVEIFRTAARVIEGCDSMELSLQGQDERRGVADKSLNRKGKGKGKMDQAAAEPEIVAPPHAAAGLYEGRVREVEESVADNDAGDGERGCTNGRSGSPRSGLGKYKTRHQTAPATQSSLLNPG